MVSTKAGNMGMNLVGANHCVIFDTSWNPANDRQAIFRAYRYGQSRPVHVYRLVTRGGGLIEGKIYKRQVTKAATWNSVNCSRKSSRRSTNLCSTADGKKKGNMWVGLEDSGGA